MQRVPRRGSPIGAGGPGGRQGPSGSARALHRTPRTRETDLGGHDRVATSLRPPSPVATGPRGAAALGRGAGGAYLASSPPRILPLCQAYPFSVLSRARDRPWELETKRQLNPRAKERPHFLFPHLWRWQGLGSSWALPVRGCPEREESGVTFSFLEFNFNRAHLTLPTVIFFFFPRVPSFFLA